MCVQNKIDNLFKMNEEELRTLVTNNLSISEIRSIIDMLRNYDKVMDEQLELDEISYKENDITKEIEDLKKQLDFSRKTLASDKELEILKSKIDELMNSLSNLNDERLSIIKKYDDIRNEIINVCLDAIKNANDAKIELARQEKLDSYTVDLQVLINKKRKLEVTYISLNKSSGYRENKVKIEELKSKIKQIEHDVNHGILDMTIELTNEVVRYRNMIHELSLTDSNTYKYLEKINKELAYTNSKISEINSIILELENMNIAKYREKLVDELTPSVIEQNYLNQKQVYDSLIYPIKVKDNITTNNLLEEFNKILEDIKCPVIKITASDNLEIANSLLLIDADKKVNYIELLINILNKSLSLYNDGFDTKYIKTNVESNNLFNVPFERNVWEEYFATNLEDKDINFLNLINSKYLSLSQKYTISKNNSKLSNKYKDIIIELLDELYYKLLSKYITTSNQYNTTLDDYKDIDSYNSYISNTKNYLSEKLNKLNNLLTEITEKEKDMFDEINAKYDRLSIIKEDIKRYLSNEESIIENNNLEDINLSNATNEDSDTKEAVVDNIIENTNDVVIDDLSDNTSLEEDNVNNTSLEDVVDNANIFDQNIFQSNDIDKEDNYSTLAIDKLLSELETDKEDKEVPTFEVPTIGVNPYTNFEGIDSISEDNNEDASN